jgi:ABC-2 type transport system ATP-binding protein
MAPAPQAIACRDLRKTYGDVRALDGVSFATDTGRVLALLGSNGSGKTTTVRILTTLSAPDSGFASVAGKDVVAEAASVRETIGLTAQETIIDTYLTGQEHLSLIARLRHIPRQCRAQEVAALVSEFELEDVARARVSTYSGGTRRRLDIATSLIGNPAVLFLDEPSTGLDPHSRERMWDAIRRRAREGTTVLLTTQYMEEADALADHIVVLARGQVIATGTPSELKNDVGGRAVELTLANPEDARQAVAILATNDILTSAGETSETLDFVLPNAGPPVLAILQSLDAGGVAVTDVIVRRPTLDETFLRLTDTTEGPPEKQHARVAQ